MCDSDRRSDYLKYVGDELFVDKSNNGIDRVRVAGMIVMDFDFMCVHICIGYSINDLKIYYTNYPTVQSIKDPL